MPPARLDLVRFICKAWERGDHSSADWAHAQIEFVIPDGPQPGAWQGHEQMAAAMREVLSAWVGARQEVDEYLELDDERVLVLVRRFGRGKRSGLDVAQLGATNGALLFCVGGGLVTRLVFYWDRERALADLGLGARDAADGRD
jgi:ketosteroid isomerase-like protein